MGLRGSEECDLYEVGEGVGELEPRKSELFCSNVVGEYWKPDTESAMTLVLLYIALIVKEYMQQTAEIRTEIPKQMPFEDKLKNSTPRCSSRRYTEGVSEFGD